MKLLGNRVYLLLPPLPESKFSIGQELKNELQKDFFKKMDKLKVFAVADSVKDTRTGDEVYVHWSVLERSPIIEIDGDKVISVAMFDISHVW